jgi:hypothetical protein
MTGDLVVMITELDVVVDLHMAAVADVVGMAVLDLDVDEHNTGTVCVICSGSPLLYRI